MSPALTTKAGIFPQAGLSPQAGLFLPNLEIENNTGDLFLRPDGLSRYLRPDGTSLYLRP